MSMVRVWLREPHHTDEGAVKLVISDSSDVSDVLLRVPDFLRVDNLKPSEIQAEHHGMVLSNRLILRDIFGSSGEGTLVIRPRCGVLTLLGNLSSNRETHGLMSHFNSSLSYQRIRPLPSPKRGEMDGSAKGSTKGLKQSASCTTGLYGSVTSRNTGGSRVTLESRTHSLFKHRGSIDRSVSRSTNGNPEANISKERSSNKSAAPLKRLTQNRKWNVTSRFRQEAEKMKALSVRNNTNFVCDNFKPQWGKPLCVICGHSKHVHSLL
uniref:WGS project CAEQ00000000 data, annotated contig 1735 n=1 Tax=Trypanosoma congolense (strain IL3000) TaxID=1068625 RepID=F9W8H8_TRYCI|nr:unnamed protein product [Trypanosoma congolense IL3000]